MKEIKATIQPHMLSKVVQALHEIQHFPGMTVFKCQGQSRGRGAGGTFVVTEDGVLFHNKERIEIICSDECAEEVVTTILNNARTGNPGDGVITVCELATVTRIRTAESGDSAL